MSSENNNNNNNVESIWTSLDAVVKAREYKLAYGMHIPEPVPDFKISDYRQEIENKFDITKMKYVNRGSYGSVFKGVQAKSGTKYSVKVMSTTFTDPTILFTFHKRAKDEIHFMQTIQHENIVKYFDCIKIDDQITQMPIHIMIKMEHLDQTLHHAISIKTFDARQCLRILEQIGDALSYLHEQWIAHHDIKPANIMIEKFDASTDANTYTYKLIDFGLAKRYSNSCPIKTTRDTATRGTPLFSPPEKIRRVSYNPFLADSYSLGLTLAMSHVGEDVVDNLWEDRIGIVSVAVLNRHVRTIKMTKILSRLLNVDPDKRCFIYQVLRDTRKKNCTLS